MRSDPAGRPVADPQTIAVQALGWIAAEPAMLSRFLALTGVDAGTIRLAASEPGFLSAVLEFICAHRQTLETSAAESGMSPASIDAARAALARPGDGVWDSV